MKAQLRWKLECCVESRWNVPSFVILGFQQKDGIKSQVENNDSFFKLSLNKAKCKNGSEKSSETANSCLYTESNCCEAFGENVSKFVFFLLHHENQTLLVLFFKTLTNNSICSSNALSKFLYLVFIAK